MKRRAFEDSTRICLSLGVIAFGTLSGCQLISGLDELMQVGADASAQSEVDATVDELPPVQLGAACEADDACDATQACVEGACIRRCELDRDCGAGGQSCHEIARDPGGNARICLRACDFVTQEECSGETSCAQLDATAATEAAPQTSFCVVPAETCVTNRRCDEPTWGTRLCAAGSDAEDCACAPSVSGASCDLVTQCGCSPGSHCALRAIVGPQVSLSCVSDLTSPREAGSPCNDEVECRAGYSCWRGICEKYCASDAECGEGRCIPLASSGQSAGVEVCTVACDFDSEKGCAKGTRCVHAPDDQTYCLLPRSPCPFTGDGTCDEPEGTRICVDGSDAQDCP